MHRANGYPRYADPDFFLCVQVNCAKEDDQVLTEAWVIGYILKGKFSAKKEPVFAGTKTGGSRDKQGTMPTDVWNIKFKDLTSPKNPKI